MKPHVSGYERGRNIVRVLVVLAIVLGVAALMFTQENSREQMLLVIGSAACVVGVIVASLRLPALRKADRKRCAGPAGLPKVQARSAHRREGEKQTLNRPESAGTPV